MTNVGREGWDVLTVSSFGSLRVFAKGAIAA